MTKMEQSSYVFSRNVRSDAEMARHACFTFGAFGMSSGPSTSLGFILAALPGRSDALTSQAGNSSRALKKDLCNSSSPVSAVDAAAGQERLPSTAAESKQCKRQVGGRPAGVDGPTVRNKPANTVHA
jgi:hypothetical protein